MSNYEIRTVHINLPEIVNVDGFDIDGVHENYGERLSNKYICTSHGAHQDLDTYLSEIYGDELNYKALRSLRSGWIVRPMINTEDGEIDLMGVEGFIFDGDEGCLRIEVMYEDDCRIELLYGSYVGDGLNLIAITECIGGITGMLNLFSHKPFHTWLEGAA